MLLPFRGPPPLLTTISLHYGTLLQACKRTQTLNKLPGVQAESKKAQTILFIARLRASTINQLTHGDALVYGSNWAVLEVLMAEAARWCVPLMVGRLLGFSYTLDDFWQSFAEMSRSSGNVSEGGCIRLFPIDRQLRIRQWHRRDAVAVSRT